MALAAGESLQEILGGLGHVAEGVYTAPAILSLARQKNVDLPIVQAVCRLIQGAPVQAVLQDLLSRDPVDEDH
jgi:glycerol-3-phosphate dehydrogenase (NAD(P)+)